MSPGRRPMPETRPASSSTTPTTRITIPSTISIRPRSDMGWASSSTRSVKQGPLAGRTAGGWLALQVRVRLAGHAAAPRLARDEADLQQVGFHDFRDRFRLVVDRRRHRLQAHRAAVVDVDDRLQEPAVELVEPPAVHALAAQRILRDRLGDDTVSLDLGVVAHPAQQTIRDARRAPRAARDLARAGLVDARLQDGGRARDDAGQLVVR